MIRVLHVIGSLNYGGSQALVLSLLEHINRENVIFDFIIDHDQERQLEERILNCGSKIYSLPSFKGVNFLEYKKAWNNFFIQHPEYHIIHGHVRSTASIYLGIAKRHGLITIAHSHSTNSGKGVQAAIKDILQYFIRYKADYFFSCSDEAGEWLFGKKTVSSDKYYLVPNGIDFDLYKPDNNERLNIRSKLGLNDSVVYGHVGRFNEAKNHIFLINVFKEIRAINPKAKLLLVGGFDDTIFPKIKEYVSENGLSNSVIFYGPSSEIHKILNAMDYFVFPSLWEGFGIAVLEAQANGLPCFVSNTIPSTARISSNYKRMDLDKTPKFWAKSILESDLHRTDGAYDSRYDIVKISSNLEALYLKIDEGNENENSICNR